MNDAYFFHMHHSPTYLSREHMNPKLTCSQRQWLHSSVGRASHRYREVTGSSPVEVLNFFQASLRNCKNCDHNCEDHSSFDILLLTIITNNKLLLFCITRGVTLKGNKEEPVENQIILDKHKRMLEIIEEIVESE